MTPMGKYTLIPHGGVRINNQGLEWYAEDSNEHWVVDGNASLDNTAFGLGLGMNYDAGADILVVGDFGFAYEKEKIKIDFADADYAPWDYEEETGYTILPYFKLGIDAHVFNWMNLRAGVMTIWERWNHTRNYTLYDYYEWDTGAVDRSDADPYTYTYLGGGFHWGNFSIDACVNPEFLGNGPYFITGENTDGFADRVSLKYDFLANHRDQ
jgi:hypothetical protein